MRRLDIGENTNKGLWIHKSDFFFFFNETTEHWMTWQGWLEGAKHALGTYKQQNNKMKG